MTAGRGRPRLAAALLALLLAGACAAPKPAAPPPEVPPELESRENFVREHKKMALRYGIRGELAKALEHWELVILLDPNDAEARQQYDRTASRIAVAVGAALKRAAQLEKEGRFDEARIRLLAALKFDPYNAEARERLRRMSRLGMLEIRPRPRTEDRGTRPKGYQVPVAKEAEGLLRQGRLEEAVALLADFVKENPGARREKTLLRRAYEGRIVELRDKGRGEEARTVLAAALVFFPGDKGLQALLSAPGGKPSASKGGSRPGRSQLAAMASRAKAAEAEGDLDGAIETWERILEIDARYPGAEKAIVRIRNRMAVEAHLRRAGRFREQGEFEAAFDEWRKALDLDPENAAAREGIRKIRGKLADLHFNRGLMHYRKQELDLAVAEWGKVLEIDPDHRKAAEYLDKARRMLERLKQIEEAAH